MSREQNEKLSTLHLPEQKRHIILNGLLQKNKITSQQCHELSQQGPYFTVEQIQILRSAGVSDQEITDHFPKLPTGEEKVNISKSQESGGHIVE